ncbi:hypothetical protein [Acidianus hospitalis]|nr:hypothetical protein [Acidianus hospitalis]
MLVKLDKKGGLYLPINVDEFYKNWRVKGAESLARGWIAPL